MPLKPDRILTLAQVADEQIVPLSKTTLYRVAEAGEGPFWKRRGRWLTIESDLKEWVREGERGAGGRAAEVAPGNPKETVLERVMRIRAEESLPS